jgi:hypothetical protein
MSNDPDRGIELARTFIAMTEHLEVLQRKLAIRINRMIAHTSRCDMTPAQHPLGDHLIDHAVARAAQREAVSLHTQAWLAAIAKDDVSQLIINENLGLLSGIASAEHGRMRPKVARRVCELREDTNKAEERIRSLCATDHLRLSRAIDSLDQKMLRCAID